MPAKNWEPQSILKQHVLQAAKKWDAAGYKNFKNSISYDVIIDGRAYPPKAISSCAHELATGRPLESKEFGGAKDGTWHRRLKELGFSVIEKRPQIDFYMEVTQALKLPAKKREELLRNLATNQPDRIITQVYRYKRSPLIVAERLFRANGKCEKCEQPAPFKRKKDGSPYLEVHHKLPLSRGGLDVIDNTMAVCPNCHCKIHDDMDLDLLND